MLFLLLSSAIITFSKMTRSAGHKVYWFVVNLKNFNLFVWTGSFAFSLVLLCVNREFQIRFFGRDRKWISHMIEDEVYMSWIKCVQFVSEMLQNAKITVHPDYHQITYENHRLKLWSKLDFLKWKFTSLETLIFYVWKPKQTTHIYIFSMHNDA